MRPKLVLAFSSIIGILLISSIISVMEYRTMSDYVSGLIADNINSVNVAQRLSDVSSTYNLDILSVIGDETSVRLPDFDEKSFMAHCDSLRSSLTSKIILPLADSVVYSYSAFMLTSLELQNVLLSDFIDSRSWYFERLQPRYNRLCRDIDRLTSAIYNDLKQNSENFDSGFYRSIIPGIVAVGVGVVLVLLLLFYLLFYYVKPLYKMLDALKAFLSHGKKYNFTFEGDDQLSELNNSIYDLTVENRQLKQRINILKGKEQKG
jgi:hypothetical protein